MVPRNLLDTNSPLPNARRTVITEKFDHRLLIHFKVRQERGEMKTRQEGGKPSRDITITTNDEAVSTTPTA